MSKVKIKKELKLKTIQRTVLSFCDIPDDIREAADYLFSGQSCDCYIEYRITPKKYQNENPYGYDLDNWLISEYPEIEGRTILIHLDY